MNLQDQRCDNCRRLLFKIEPGALSGALAIKCPRCKAHTILRPQTSPSPKRQTTERDGKEGQHARIQQDRTSPAPGKVARQTHRKAV
uniref:Com family DNA-binding transcriptional regulator n=1 Tax=Phaeobacter sp. PT47_59 TaxID=3029979 RepID=UPI00406CB9BF